jgi:TusA-related sulfurtransferase
MSDAVCVMLDLRGMDSPVLPLLVRRALSGLAAGATLEVRLSSSQWARDLPVILGRCGECCLGLEQLPWGWRLLVRRGGANPR